MTEGDENRVVKALQTPTAVVTYRAIVGSLAALTVALIAFIGRDIESGIHQLQASMVNVQVTVARNAGRIDSQDSRLGRVETSVEGLAKENGALDHRVTVIEARQSRH